jgi:hypothetical protein
MNPQTWNLEPQSGRRLGVQESLHGVVQPIDCQPVLAGDAGSGKSNRVGVCRKARFDVGRRVASLEHERHAGVTDHRDLAMQSGYRQFSANRAQESQDRVAARRSAIWTGRRRCHFSVHAVR